LLKLKEINAIAVQLAARFRIGPFWPPAVQKRSDGLQSGFDVLQRLDFFVRADYLDTGKSLKKKDKVQIGLPQ
jgi:hypothetical protein